MANFELNVKINGLEQTVSTIGGLEQALADTNAQLSKVEENSKDFKFLQNQAQNLDKVLQAVSKDAGEFNKQLKNVDTTAKQLNSTFNTTTQAAAELGNNPGVDNLAQDIQKTSSSSASLRLELRKITQELQGLDAGSARFVELSNRAGELRDQIADTNAIINATAGNTTERFGRALASTAQIGVAGFQAIQGAQALFGSENEEIQQAMLKLQALLNLSQAIETFGSLGDRIKEIKAGMGLLTTATATQTVVTEGATVATTGLNLAMRALPIFLLIGGLAALASGIFSYLNRSKEASKEEIQRKKNMEALAKVQAESAKAVAKETVEFNFLVFQLSKTNKGSKERIDLINKLNKSYGTTFKNLKDERLFQEQLNASIEEYTKLQYNRFKLTKNYEYLQKAQEKLYLAEQASAKLMREFEKDRRKAGEVITYYDQALGANTMTTLKADETLGMYRDRMGLFNADLMKQENIISDLTDKMEQLNKRRLQLLGVDQNLTENGKKYNNTQDDINKSTATANKLGADETALAIFKNDLKQDEIKLIIETQQASAAKTKSVIDDLNVEQQVALDDLQARYLAAIKTNKEEVKDKRKSKSEEKAIISEFENAKKKIEDDYAQKKIDAGNKEALENQKLLDELKLQNDILNSEILFGDQNVADQKAELQQRSLALSIKDMEATLAFGKLDLKEYEKLIQEKLNLQGQYNVKTLEIQTKVADNARSRDLQNFIELQQTLLGVQIVANKKKAGEDEAAFSERLKKEGEYQFIREDGTLSMTENLTAIEKQSYENIIKQRSSLDERYAADVTQLTNEYVDENVQTQEDADKKVFDRKMAYLNQYFSEASKALQQFNSSGVAGLSGIVNASLQGIQEYFKLVDKDFSSLSEKVAAYSTAISSVLSGIISAFQQQNQAQLEAELNSLQTQSDRRRDDLTARYNEEVELQKQNLEQGLINEEQYRAAVESIDYKYNQNTKEIDKQLNKDKRVQQEKAFNREKGLKIAQTIIAGLQGAVQAFTGALELGPIVGPIVGGILAGAVGTLTGINVAQIKKTQLGGTTETQTSTALPPSSVSTSAGSALSSAGGGFTAFTSQATGAPTINPGTTGFDSSTSIQKVIVVESDITNAQNRVRVLENNSTFG